MPTTTLTIFFTWLFSGLRHLQPDWPVHAGHQPPTQADRATVASSLTHSHSEIPFHHETQYCAAVAVILQPKTGFTARHDITEARGRVLMQSMLRARCFCCCLWKEAWGKKAVCVTNPNVMLEWHHEEMPAVFCCSV